MKTTSGRPRGSDTSHAARRLQIELWRGMSALEKARLAGATSRDVRRLSWAGIRQRHPSASERECLLRYAVLTLGRPLALRAYPDLDLVLVS